MSAILGGLGGSSGGGNWWDSALNFIGDNIKPIAGIAATGYGIYESDRQRSKQVDELRRQAEEEFARRQALQAQQGAYSSAASAAAAAAARQNEANRIAALKRQMQIERRGFNKASGMLQPYADMAGRIMPQMEGAYSGALNNANLLAQYIFNPAMMQKLNQGVPAYSVKLPFKLPMEG